MFFIDNKKHSKPHIHVEYNDQVAVIGIPEGDLLEGTIPKNKMKLVEAWIEIHKDELMANWKLAVEGKPLFKNRSIKVRIL